MLASFFRPKHKPRSTREMIRVLRAAAQFSDQPDEKAEYDQAADALDRVLTAAARHSDAPTRDAFAYALGRAELDLGDKLTEVVEVTKATHMDMQALHQDVQKQGAAAGELWAAFQSFVEHLTQWREEIEHWRGQVDATLATYAATLASFRQSRDRSSEERQTLLQDQQLLRGDMDESKLHRARMQLTLDTALPAIENAMREMNGRHGGQIKQLAEQITELAGQLQEIQRLLEPAGSHEAGS